MLLSAAEINKVLRIISITKKDETSSRISELGIVPGEEITILSVAPLGDPIRISIKGYQLALRKSEAALIEVELA